jgi:6-phosphofructo-2-kinase/fructose-2,6-biphosphatase 2
MLAEECMESLITWLKEGGNVGIHGASSLTFAMSVCWSRGTDATNSTRKRRTKLMERVSREKGFRLIFLETVCTDSKIIDANIAVKVSSGDPDYDGIPREKAEADFRNRIALYERSYETIDPDVDKNVCYAKIINVGSQVIVNKIDGYLQSRIVFYLMNLHLTPRSIYLTRVRLLATSHCDVRHC